MSANAATNFAESYESLGELRWVVSFLVFEVGLLALAVLIDVGLGAPVIAGLIGAVVIMAAVAAIVLVAIVGVHRFLT